MSDFEFKRIKLPTGHHVYQLADGEAYQRLKGGLYWAQNGPAFVCILGECFSSNNSGGVKDLHSLYEAHEVSQNRLVERCAALQLDFPLEAWVCDREGDNEPYFRFFPAYADLRLKQDAQSKLEFMMSQKAMPDDFSLAVQTVQRRFQTNSLKLLKGGILTDQIDAAGQEDPGQHDLVQKFREIMVLAWIVNEFDMAPYDPLQKQYDRPRPPSPMAV